MTPTKVGNPEATQIGTSTTIVAREMVVLETPEQIHRTGPRRRRMTHEELVKLSERMPPPQSWWDQTDDPTCE